jgi:hypothetical protein
MRKQPVMVDPHHANECKADQEREIGWPLPKKLIAKSTVGRLGNLDLKNKQRNGNSEDSVRKASTLPVSVFKEQLPPHAMGVERASQTGVPPGSPAFKVAGFISLLRQMHHPGCARMSYNLFPTRAGKPMLLFSSCLKIASVSRALTRAVYSISQ